MPSPTRRCGAPWRISWNTSAGRSRRTARCLPDTCRSGMKTATERESAVTYDPNNIFAKILLGEIPAHRDYEDAHTFAFMDIMPRADGHVLVIPKAPARGLLGAEPDSLAHVARTVQKVARAVKTAMQ